MKKNWFFVVILVFMLSSCVAPLNGILVKEATSTPTEIPVPTATPTLTPEPTFTPTLTVTPQPTPTLRLTPTPVEWELVPYFEKVVEYEWKGVLIKARLIIDESMSSKIESIEISDELLAEIVARTLYVVWVSRQGVKFWNDTPPLEINSYMELWARAQASGLASDWRKVQIDDIWANDLTDGNGYVQKPYDIWPMYFGHAPNGIIPVNMVTIAYVSMDGFDNMTILNESAGVGSNLDDGDLLVYRSFNYEKVQSLTNGVTVRSVIRFCTASTGTWLALNDGGLWEGSFYVNSPIYTKTGGMKIVLK